MAERNSTRASNRRNTPQSPPKVTKRGNGASDAPKQVRRATRSQSRDISDVDSIAPTKGRNLRDSSVESGGSRGGRKKRPGTRARPLQELPTVAEASTVEDEREITPQLADDDENLRQQRQPPDPKSPSGLSAISGTTAMTSHSVRELADLDAQAMVDDLVTLSNGAETMLQQLALQNAAPKDIIRSLQDEDSRASKRLDRTIKTHDHNKAVYGNERYINRSIALRALMGVRRYPDVKRGDWRPDDIFQQANLATMLAYLLPTHARSVNTRFLAEKLDREFPAPFLTRLVTSDKGRSAGDSLLKETFEIGLDLRTQTFIEIVNSHSHEPNFDPDEALTQSFMDDAGDWKGWDVEQLHPNRLTKKHIGAVTKRIMQLRTAFREDSPSIGEGRLVDVKALNDEFPWAECVERLMAWARLRHDEIHESLASLGGVDAIQTALESEMRRRASLRTLGNEVDDPPIRLTVSSLSPRSDSASVEGESKQPVTLKPGTIITPSGKFDSIAVIGHFKQRVAAEVAKQAGVVTTPKVTKSTMIPSASTAGPSRTHQNGINSSAVPFSAPTRSSHNRDPTFESRDEWELAAVGDDKLDEIVNQPRPSRPRPFDILQTHRGMLVEQNKENQSQIRKPGLQPRSFIERQPNAEKVFFDSQTSGREALSDARKRKRDIMEAEDRMSDPSQDESFQTDQRGHHSSGILTKGKRRRLLPTAGAKAQKKARLLEEEDDTDESNGDLRGAIQKHNTTISDTRTSEDGPSTVAEAYHRCSQIAKDLTYNRPPKGPQKRVAWSDEEITTFIELIEQYGTSWRRLKEKDTQNVLINRDQTALKDKARNMKFDFLKGGGTLPLNFELISIKASQRKILAEFGVQLDD